MCRHGVPEELLSGTGTTFLLDHILELCSLLGIRHPQIHGLV